MASRDKRGVLHNQEPLGPLPMGRIKRVDEPTTIVTDAVQRVDLRNLAYDLARRGEYGRAAQKGVQQSLPGKYPLSAAQKDVMDHLCERLKILWFHAESGHFRNAHSQRPGSGESLFFRCRLVVYNDIVIFKPPGNIRPF